MRPNTVVILLIVAASLSPMAAGAQAQPRAELQNRSMLTAEGSGQSQAKPDFARVTALVSAKAQSLDGAVAAEQQLAERATSLLQSLSGDGLEIEKSNFSLANDRPTYPKPDTSQGPPSFTAMTTFSLKANRIDRVNGILGKLASSGLVELRAVSFEVADSRPALDEARRNAVADARHRAEVLADAAGVRLDEVVTISDANAAPRVYAFDGAQAGGAQLVVPPATLSFTASVSIGWHISPKP